MPIQVGGIISGLETESLIEKILEIEKEPIEALTKKQDAFTVQLSAYSELQKKLKALDDAFEGLDDTTDFSTFNASSGDEDIFTATAGMSAVPGSYDVTVQQLAKAHKLKSGGFDQTDEIIQFTVDANNKFINFSENGGAELTATLTEGTYSISELVNHVKTQMETASDGGGNNIDYTISYDTSTKNFSITESGSSLTQFDLLWGSGADTANSAASLLGFDATDDTGALTYSSDSEVGEGTLHIEIGNTFTIDDSNNRLDFIEEISSVAGPELSATIANGTYTIKELESAVETAMENASSYDYTVSFDDATQKFSITGNEGTLTDLQLLWDSGTNSSSNVAATLGYEKTDDTGATSHAGDNEVGTVIDVAIKASDTIEDVARAINDSDADVTATVIFDGTDHILTLVGKNSGEDNTINLTVTDADGNNTDTNGLSRLVYDAGVTANLTQTQAAQDAIIDVDGVTNIKRASNTISDVITGVTLTLKDAHTTPATDKDTLTVSRNTENITEKVETFVSAYNELLDFFAEYQKKYDEEEKTAGVLVGDSTTNMIRRTMRSQLFSTLQLNATNTFTVDNDNNKLDFKIDTGGGIGSQLSATIESGTYTIGAMEKAIENAMEAEAGGNFTVIYNNDAQKFSITGDGLTELQLMWGSGTNLANSIGATIGFDAIDDTGSTTYTADTVTGVGDATKTYAYKSLADIGITLNQEKDPRLEVDSTALSEAMSANYEDFRTFFTQSTKGAEGFAVKMMNAIDGIVDTFDGTLTARKTGITTSIGRLEEKKEFIEARAEKTEIRLWAQFNSLELLLSQYNSTGQFLTQQITGLQNLNKSISG